MNEPTSFRAGDSVTWTTTLPAYPSAAGWSIKYRLLWPTGSAVDITTTADGCDYTALQTATDTATWPAGTATLVTLAEKGSGAALQRVTLGQEAVTILPNLATATTLDNRSQAVKGLADARAALAAYMAQGKLHVAEYDIAGRRMKFRAASEITDLIGYYEREVARERAASAILQGGSPGRVLSRF